MLQIACPVHFFRLRQVRRSSAQSSADRQSVYTLLPFQSLNDEPKWTLAERYKETS